MSSVASASVAEAVMPTAVLSAAFSATVLAVASESLVAPMSTSSTSVRVSVKVWSAVEPSGCRTDGHGAGLAGLAVEGIGVGDGDDAGGAVADLERAVAGLGGDGVGHGVGGRVGVAGRGGDPDGRAVGDALGHGVGRVVGVGRGGDVGLVDVCQGEGEGLVGRGAVGTGRSTHACMSRRPRGRGPRCRRR